MTATLERPKTTVPAATGKPRYRKRKTTSWLVTGLAGLFLFVFLMPLGYMVVSSVKTKAQITNPQDTVLPMSPAVFEYEGRDLDMFAVPFPDGEIRDLAMLQPGRQSSVFIDPGDVEAGPIEWAGNWRTIERAIEFSPNWVNYERAWSLMNFPQLLRNTVVIAGVGTVGAVLSSILVAYGLARFRIPFGRTIMVVLIATIILPGFVTLVPKYVLFFRIGWIDTWLPLIVPHFFANAFNVFLLRQYFLTIPYELDEAAYIDGAGPFRTLVSVVLPQMKAAIVAVSLFHFYFAWNDFFEPMIYLSTRRDLQPISVGLRFFNTQYDSSPELIQAGAMLALIIPVIVFLFAQRVFLKGIDLSGVQK